MNKHITREEVASSLQADIGVTSAREIADACHRAERALVLLMGTPKHYDAEYYQTRVVAANAAVGDLRKVLGNV